MSQAVSLQCNLHDIIFVHSTFSNKVLAKSEGLQSLGIVQWQLALYLLLCWVIVFLCLLKGIHSAGKVCKIRDGGEVKGIREISDDSSVISFFISP